MVLWLHTRMPVVVVVELDVLSGSIEGVIMILNEVFVGIGTVFTTSTAAWLECGHTS